MQFVVVTFPTQRTVWVDGVPVGQTGQLLALAEGSHSFDLGVPADYAPATQVLSIVDTSPSSPSLIVFNPLPVPLGKKPDPRRRKKTPPKAVKKKGTAKPKTVKRKAARKGHGKRAMRRR